jgi:membrane dipeptidase
MKRYTTLMKKPITPMFLFVFVVLSSACRSVAPETSEQRLGRARRLARETLIVDGHIDVPYRLQRRRDDVSRATDGGDFDYPRAVEGGLDAPFMSIYVPASLEADGGSKALADHLIDLVEEIATDAPEKFGVAHSTTDVKKCFDQGRVALLLGMENGSPIEGDLANLEHFYRRGIRYITLCHSKDNHICDSSYDGRHSAKGLTAFGRQVVDRMNELGVIIDVSHISDDTFWQVMERTRAPVLATHSSMRHFTPGFERNMSDEMVRKMGETGSVVMINFGSAFISDAFRLYRETRSEAVADFCDAKGVERDSEEAKAYIEAYNEENPLPFADVADVADHIDHVVQLVGIDHVGLGSDFDGVGDSLPTGLKDVSEYPNLIAELMRRGYSDDDLRKICSGNAMRVLAAVERVAAQSTP